MVTTNITSICTKFICSVSLQNNASSFRSDSWGVLLSFCHPSACAVSESMLATQHYIITASYMSWRFLYIGELFRTHWPSEAFPDFKLMKWLCDISAAKNHSDADNGTEKGKTTKGRTENELKLCDKGIACSPKCQCKRVHWDWTLCILIQFNPV